MFKVLTLTNKLFWDAMVKQLSHLRPLYVWQWGIYGTHWLSLMIKIYLQSSDIPKDMKYICYLVSYLLRNLIHILLGHLSCSLSCTKHKLIFLHLRIKSSTIILMRFLFCSFLSLQISDRIIIRLKLQNKLKFIW